MTTYSIKKIDVLKTSLTLAIVALVLSLIAVVLGFFVPMSLIMEPSSMTGSLFGTAFGNITFLGIILVPIGAFITTFITVALFALVYNFAAEHFGGITFEFE